MPDPIQSTSTIPVPYYQQINNQNNLAVVNSPTNMANANNQVVNQNQNTNQNNFEDYLNQQSITTLEANKKSTVFDPVQDLFQNGVYQTTGQGNPI